MKGWYQFHQGYDPFIAGPDTVQQKEEAFEYLLKHTIRACRACKGTGRVIHPDREVNVDVKCFYCSGDGVICSFCRASERYCGCGSEDK